MTTAIIHPAKILWRFDNDFAVELRRATARVFAPMSACAWRVGPADDSWWDLVWRETAGQARQAGLHLFGTINGDNLTDMRAVRAPWADDLSAESDAVLEAAKRKAGWPYDPDEKRCVGCGLYRWPLVPGSELGAGGLADCCDDCTPF